MSSIIGSRPIINENLIFATDNFSVKSLPGDGTMLNLVNNRGVGTITNSGGVDANGLLFNGTSTIVSFPNSYVENLSDIDLQYSGTGGGPEVYTLECWVKLLSKASGDTTAGMHLLGNNDDTGVGIQIMLNGGLNKINFGYRTNSNDYCTSCDLQIGTWYHILGSRGPTSGVRIYLDGVEVFGSAYSATDMDIDNSNANMQFGQSSARILGFLHGYMPIARIYKKEFTLAEVVHNYNAEKVRFGL